MRDYSGLRFRNITPTDIDGFVEYRNKAYIFLELKYGDAPLPPGQRLALERLCDDLQKRKPTLLIVATHHSAHEDIDAARATIAEFRYKGRWRMRRGTVKDLMRAFLDYVETWRK